MENKPEIIFKTFRGRGAMEKLIKKVKHLKRIAFINGMLSIIIGMLWEFVSNVMGPPYIFEMAAAPFWYGSAAGVVLIVLTALPDRIILNNKVTGLLYPLASATAGLFSPFISLFLLASSQWFISLALIYAAIYLLPLCLITGFTIAVLTHHVQSWQDDIEKNQEPAKVNLLSKIPAALVLLLGITVTCHGAARFNQPDDLALWDTCTIAETGVSMKMPPNWLPIEPNTDVKGIVKGILGHGTRIIVLLAEIEETGGIGPEEYVTEIIRQHTYMKNGIQYTQTVRKSRRLGEPLINYVTSIEFQIKGKRYAASISSGYIDSSLKKEIQSILDTLEVE